MKKLGKIGIAGHIGARAIVASHLAKMGYEAEIVTIEGTTEVERGLNIVPEPILITTPYPLGEIYPPYDAHSYKRGTNRTPKKKKRK